MQDQLTRLLTILLDVERCTAPACSPQCPCRKPFRDRLQHFIEQEQPIRMVLPAFPAKSPNRKKVLGELPDMAEIVALGFLEKLCRRMEACYSPGVELVLCSDGHVFADLVGLDDQQVDQYVAELQAILDDLNAHHVRLHGLVESYGPVPPNQLRGRLVADHGPDLAQLRCSVQNSDHLKSKFNGLCRFLFEDLVDLQSELSRNRNRKQAKAMAYLALQRSQAWSNRIAHDFPNALRLSIHPQRHGSSKLGIHLMPTRDAWLTPWHGVAVLAGGRFRLMKRQQAQSLGAELVWRRGRPSHFVAA